MLHIKANVPDDFDGNEDEIELEGVNFEFLDEHLTAEDLGPAEIAIYVHDPDGVTIAMSDMKDGFERQTLSL